MVTGINIPMRSIDYGFSSQLGQAEVRVDDDAPVEVSFGVYRGEVLFSERLYPVDGRILVDDLADLVDYYLERSGLVRARFALTAGAMTSTFYAIYCTANFGDTDPAEWLASHFLTCPVSRCIPREGSVRLAWIPQRDEAAECATVLFLERDGKVSQREGPAPEVTEWADGHIEADIVPADIPVPDGYTLKGVQAVVGQRFCTFYIDDRPRALHVRFRNVFGIDETAALEAVVTTSAEASRTLARSGRALSLYDYQDEMTQSVQTAPLDHREAAWLMQLAFSHSVADVTPGSPVRAMLVTEMKQEHTADPENPDVLKFTWRPAVDVPMFPIFEPDVTADEEGIFTNQFTQEFS